MGYRGTQGGLAGGQRAATIERGGTQEGYLKACRPEGGRRARFFVERTCIGTNMKRIRTVKRQGR